MGLDSALLSPPTDQVSEPVGGRWLTRAGGSAGFVRDRSWSAMGPYVEGPGAFGKVALTPHLHLV